MHFSGHLGEVLIPALEQAIEWIADDDVIAVVEIERVLPRLVALDDRSVAVPLRFVPAARKPLRSLDEHIIDK